MKKFALDVLDLMPVAFSHELYMRSAYYSVTVRAALSKQTHFLVHLLITHMVRKVVKNRLCYCPPTKLREGNVYSSVCMLVSHSVLRRGEGPHVTITHDALDLTIHIPSHDPSPLPQPPPPPDMKPHCPATPLLVP